MALAAELSARLTVTLSALPGTLCDGLRNAVFAETNSLNAKKNCAIQSIQEVYLKLGNGNVFLAVQRNCVCKRNRFPSQYINIHLKRNFQLARQFP